MYRQGDIVLVKVERIPVGATRQRECVLAEGEATGHRHEILEEAMLSVDSGGIKYVEVYGESAILVHQEHGPITLLGPAYYKVIQQREYEPSGVRHVAD